MISALTRKYPCFGVKWFLLLFSLQSISGLRRAERERERERERREIGTQKLTPLNPENLKPNSFVEQWPNPFVKPRKPIRSHHLRPSSRRSHHRRDRRTPAPIHPKPIVLVLFLLGIKNLGFVSFEFWWIWVLSSTQFRRPHSSNPVASLSQFNRIWWIFFVGICFFCVYLLRNDINICLEDEKMWKTW